jgi:hypothetical protein
VFDGRHELVRHERLTRKGEERLLEQVRAELGSEDAARRGRQRGNQHGFRDERPMFRAGEPKHLEELDDRFGEGNGNCRALREIGERSGLGQRIEKPHLVRAGKCCKGPHTDRELTNERVEAISAGRQLRRGGFVGSSHCEATLGRLRSVH